jgi:uncharacterized membrane protein HdeD (DUF308 family)
MGVIKTHNTRRTTPEDTMKTITLVGIALIVLGLAALAYQGITYTSRETVLDLGPIHATAEREKTFPLPPVLGIAAVAGGVALMVAGVRKRA